MNDFWTGFISGFVTGNVNSVILSCSGSTLTLPIMPEKVTTSVSQNNSTVNVNGDGDYNMPGKTGLHEITLEGIFPDEAYSFCDASPDSPEDNVAKIEKWRAAGSVIQVTVPESPIDFSFLIQGFSYGYEDGTRDIYFSISLKEYRYIAGISNDKINPLTGLKSRPGTMVGTPGIIGTTASQDADIAENIGKAIGRAARSGTTSPMGYMEAALKACKTGGLKPGDTIKVAMTGVSVNERTL